MDALCAAIPVARSLLRVAEASDSSCVWVTTACQRAQLRVCRGAVLEVSGVDSEPLGDALLRLGALDATRHHAALHAAFPASQVGPWLVSVGAASEVAVRRALGSQLEQRVAAVLRMRGAELLRRSAVESPDERGFDVSVDLAGTVHRGLVGIARDLPGDVLTARAGQGALRTTRLGAWLEARLAAHATPLDLPTLCAKDVLPQHRAERAALRAMGALIDATAEVEGYSLLLRKRRELKSRVSARRLLDLPENARPEKGRAAFRGLAGKLHPDRFHSGEPALLALSNEVMRALSSAEAQLAAEERGLSRSASG